MKGKFLLEGKVEGRGKRCSWCHAVKEGLGCLIESLRTGKTKEHVHFWVLGYATLCIWSVCIPVQAHLRDSMGSVPNHCDKTNIAKNIAVPLCQFGHNSIDDWLSASKVLSLQKIRLILFYWWNGEEGWLVSDFLTIVWDFFSSVYGHSYITQIPMSLCIFK